MDVAERSNNVLRNVLPPAPRPASSLLPSVPMEAPNFAYPHTRDASVLLAQGLGAAHEPAAILTVIAPLLLVLR